jgi:hypothetical protein
MGVKFEDFLNNVRFNPETFNFDEFKAAALSAAKQDDDGYTAELTARETRLAELDTANKELGADNWKLSMKLGTPIPANNDGGSKVTPPEGDPAEPELKGYDSFFTPIKKE